MTSKPWRASLKMKNFLTTTAMLSTIKGWFEEARIWLFGFCDDGPDYDE
jgi:hypothetical protein